MHDPNEIDENPVAEVLDWNSERNGNESTKREPDRPSWLPPEPRPPSHPKPAVLRTPPAPPKNGKSTPTPPTGARVPGDRRTYAKPEVPARIEPAFLPVDQHVSSVLVEAEPSEVVTDEMECTPVEVLHSDPLDQVDELTELERAPSEELSQARVTLIGGLVQMLALAETLGLKPRELLQSLAKELGVHAMGRKGIESEVAEEIARVHGYRLEIIPALNDAADVVAGKQSRGKI